MTADRELHPALRRDSLLWNIGGQGVVDPCREREVEVRIDCPLKGIQAAVELMRSEGWALSSTPDTDDDPHQRLFFRKTQNISDGAKREMIGCALRAAEASEGSFHSWMLVEELEG